MKEEVYCDVYQDDKFMRTVVEKRTVHTDTKGKFFYIGRGKVYIDDKNHYKNECWTVKGSCSFAEVLEELETEAVEREKYLKETGLCRVCKKNPAEYPNGFDPTCCKECNAKTQEILKQLSRSPGFVGLRVG